MVSVRKRRHPDREDVPESALTASAPKPEPPSMLVRLRNMWQFSCLCQWLYIFGAVAKLDNIDIDELEAQCLSPHSTTLQDIGLALLKYLSSHRGLTHDLFDEYTRRQYIAKAPELPNPFGTDAIPARFSDFTVFQKIRILHQMTLFVMMNPEKLREKMSEQKDADRDQTIWRIEPFGWDREDRIYYVLDDNRVYRSTEIPAASSKPKKNTKNSRAQARRGNKRRRISAVSVDDFVGDAEDGGLILPNNEKSSGIDEAAEKIASDGPGGLRWECIAVSLEDLYDLLASIPGKKDPNEKILHDKIVGHLLPILEQQDERRKRREKEREKELLNLAKMANAKRSSRIAGRQEQQRHDDLIREEEQKRLQEAEATRKEEHIRRKIEKERDGRLFSREKRLRERDARRAQHEEELAQLSEDSKNPDNGVGRMSERRRLAEIQKAKDALRELEEEGEEEWIFDCICGLHGKVDDGQHSVSCERCNIWQHSRCLGIDEGEADKDDFHFVCDACKQRAEDAASGRSADRPVIKSKLAKSQDEDKTTADLTGLIAPAQASVSMPRSAQISIDIPAAPAHVQLPASPAYVAYVASPLKPSNGKDTETMHSSPTIAQQAAKGGSKPLAALPSMPLVPSVLGPPESKLNGSQIVPVKVDSSMTRSTALPLKLKPAGREQRVPVLGAAPGLETALVDNRHAHPFSVPHPGLSRPNLSPRKSHAYGTIYEQQAPAQASVAPPSGPFPMPEARANAHQRPSAQATAPAPAPSLTPGSVQLSRVQLSPTSFATPRLQHGHVSSPVAFPTGPQSSPLPPFEGGLSPTKHSPIVIKEPSSGLAATSPTSLVLPPTAALSPSAPQQILTPPVKPEGAAHRQSFSGMVPDSAASHKGET